MPVKLVTAAPGEWPAHLEPPKKHYVGKLRAIVRIKMATMPRRRMDSSSRPNRKEPAQAGSWWKRCEVTWADVWAGRQREAQLIAEAEREAARSRG